MLAGAPRGAGRQGTVRVGIVESSRAIPGSARSALTDSDISFLVTDASIWQTPGNWVRALGKPLPRVRGVEVDALPVRNEMLLFVDGAKVGPENDPAIALHARLGFREAKGP